jgi:hypothetical protein
MNAVMAHEPAADEGRPATRVRTDMPSIETAATVPAMLAATRLTRSRVIVVSGSAVVNSDERKRTSAPTGYCSAHYVRDLRTRVEVWSG